MMVSEQLINSMFNRRALWDASHPDHRNRYVLDKLWKEIAEECEITVNAAHTKWKNLRDYFRRELKKIPQSRSGDPGDIAAKSHWPHFKSLLFLKDQFIPRQTTGNLEEPECSSETLDCNDLQTQSDGSSDHELNENTEESQNDEPSHTAPTPTSSRSSSSHQHSEPRIIIANKLRKRKNQVDALVAIEQQKLEFLVKKKTDQSKQIPKDEHQLYFNSLLPHVRKIKDNDILQFRNEVQNLVQKYAYQSNPASRLMETFNYDHFGNRPTFQENLF